MSNNSFKVKNGLTLNPINLTTNPPLNPQAGDLICDSSDNNKIKRYDANAAAWTEVGSGGVGGINYISNFDFEIDTAGWTAYKDAAAETPVDGVGGTSALTITSTGTDPLRGLKSGLITKTASDLQGEGVSYDFNIDAADQAQILKISFDYETSGNYKDEDVRIYVYDTTNSSVIEVVDRDLYASSFGKFVGTIQTSATSTSYRLIIHIASTSTLAYTIKLDNINVSPQLITATGGKREVALVVKKSTGLTLVNDTNTVLVGWNAPDHDTTNSFNTSTGEFTAPETGFYAYDVFYRLTVPVGTAARVNTSTQVNGSEVATTTLYNGTVAQGTGLIGGTSSGTIYLSKGDTLRFAAFQVSGANRQLEASSLRNQLSIIKIASDSSQEVIGNRQVAFQATTTTPSISLVSGQENFVTYTNITFDTTNSYDSSTGIYTIPESGVYQVFGSTVVRRTSSATLSATSTNLVTSNIVINGTAIGFGTRASSASFANQNSEITFRGGFTGPFAKGDQVRLSINPVLDGNGAAQIIASSHNLMSIHKLSSPQTVLASEVVHVEAVNTSGQSISDASSAIITGWQSTIDSNNAFNSSAGSFIAPKTGVYSVNFGFRIVFPNSTAARINAELYVNNTLKYIQTGQGAVTGASATFATVGTNISTDVFLNKGDQVNVGVFQVCGSARTLSTTSGSVYLTIKGN